MTRRPVDPKESGSCADRSRVRALLEAGARYYRRNLVAHACFSIYTRSLFIYQFFFFYFSKNHA